MNLNLFKTYIRVVETQNLSRIAEELGLSQPAVTKQIQALEDIYGILLLERSGRKLKTTEAGETLFNSAKEIIKSVEKAEKAIQEVAESRKGSLFLGASTIPGQYILPTFIKKFKDNHPNVSIKMEIADTEKIMNQVAERELDIGIIGGWSANRKVDGFEWIKDELLVIVPDNHALVKKTSLKIKDLMNEKWIFREKGSGTRKAIEDLLAFYNVKAEDLNIYIEAGSTEAVIASVEAGMGISIVSNWAIEKSKNNRKIQSIKLEEKNAKRSFYIIYPRQKTRRQTVNNFLDFLEKEKI